MKELETQNTRLVLKVDIDTKIGLLEGAPCLMDMLKKHGDIKASFFIAMGPDHSGRALKRLLKPGFLRKQLKSKAAASYGIITMMYGVLLPGPIIVQQAPQLLGQLMQAGHEVGLHGWDHVYWHDKVRHLSLSLTRAELSQAMRLFKQITGFNAASFAAPGWQVTNNAWSIMAQMGITHTSCVRGTHPFRPLVEDKALPLVEIPTTMPSLDEALGRHDNPNQAADWLAEQIKPGELNVFTLHGEVEGRTFKNQFMRFLDKASDKKVEFITLRQAALQACRQTVPTGSFYWGSIDNRAGQLAIQA